MRSAFGVRRLAFGDRVSRFEVHCRYASRVYSVGPWTLTMIMHELRFGMLYLRRIATGAFSSPVLGQIENYVFAQIGLVMIID